MRSTPGTLTSQDIMYGNFAATSSAASVLIQPRTRAVKLYDFGETMVASLFCFETMTSASKRSLLTARPYQRARTGVALRAATRVRSASRRNWRATELRIMPTPLGSRLKTKNVSWKTATSEKIFEIMPTMSHGRERGEVDKIVLVRTFEPILSVDSSALFFRRFLAAVPLASPSASSATSTSSSLRPTSSSRWRSSLGALRSSRPRRKKRMIWISSRTESEV
mmetsp:Transcript_7044/g.21510  ORF Transcript_7044/g.21510 Transcript_7044/m.21510 type:complete len:223 (-) Transcript_7044:592-1260(-)